MTQSEAPVALYQQMKDAIRDAIARGRWRPGDRVPSEHELTREYGVSRMTANRVLRELTQEGLILRTQGVGSFVARLQPIASVLKLPEIHDDIIRRGGRHAARVLELRKIAAEHELAQVLGVRSRAPVFSVQIVHTEDGMPVQFEDRYVNPAVCSDFLQQDFTRLTPAQYLAEMAPLTEAEHMLEAAAASSEAASALQIPREAPCLLLYRREFCGSQVASVARLWHPGGRYRLSGHFRP